MKMLIFGAGSKTGVILAELALEAGHEVTAFIRRPHESFPDNGPVKTIIGDVLDPDSVAEAVPGHDAVYVLLGPKKGSPADITERGTRYIIDAMEKSGTRRLVVTGTVGTGTPPQAFRGADRRLMLLFRLFARKFMADRSRQFEVIRACSLEWTIGRLPVLNDRLPDGAFTEVPEPGALKPGFNRRTAARCLLSVLNQPELVGRAPLFNCT